jgi:hypothetical protein
MRQQLHIRWKYVEQLLTVGPACVLPPTLFNAADNSKRWPLTGPRHQEWGVAPQQEQEDNKQRTSC